MRPSSHSHRAYVPTGRQTIKKQTHECIIFGKAVLVKKKLRWYGAEKKQRSISDKAVKENLWVWRTRDCRPRGNEHGVWGDHKRKALRSACVRVNKESCAGAQGVQGREERCGWEEPGTRFWMFSLARRRNVNATLNTTGSQVTGLQIAELLPTESRG